MANIVARTRRWTLCALVGAFALTPAVAAGSGPAPAHQSASAAGHRATEAARHRAACRARQRGHRRCASTSARRKAPETIITAGPTGTVVDATGGTATAPFPAGPCVTADPAHTTQTPQTGWRALGSLPISDAEAAAAVTPMSERRPGNTDANHYCPTDADLAVYHSAVDKYGQSEANLGSTFNPYHKYVSGRFVGTTDEIIQWAAHKWGVPEDWLRAQYVNESNWNQGSMGDRTTVADPTLYPAASRILGTSDVYESLGISQIKWRPAGAMNTGTEPLRWKSTAFAVDYEGSVIRYYFDDPMQHRSGWGDASYKPGDPWLSIAGWWQPSPWGNSGQLAYVDHLKATLGQRTWEKPGF